MIRYRDSHVPTPESLDTDGLDLTPEQDATLWGYLEMAALSMQNRFPDDAEGDLSPH